MEETLQQLRILLLGSIPTIFLFLLIVICYRVLVYGPLTRVLKERRERTEGAIEQANAATAAAAAKAQEYEAQLRAARGKIFAARQARQQQWAKEKDAAVAEAQETAHRKVQEAKSALANETSAAHKSMESSIDQLAGEILEAILPGRRAAAGRAR